MPVWKINMMPFFSFFKKKEETQYFIALLLRDEKVSVVIFEEARGKIQAVSYHEKYFEKSIEYATNEEFLNALDEVISIGETALPKEAIVQKTVFGLKENWIEESSSSGSKIKKEYLQKLKNASDSLDLKPLGFMVIHEAIAHLMSEEEGAPASAILIEIDKRNVAVSILRAGRIIETKRAEIEDSIPKTCDKILHHFDCEILPAKIAIFDGKNSELLQQEFIGHTWSKSLSFLHVPQITVLPKGFDARAILYGTATQMGFEILVDTKVEKENETIEPDLEKREIKEVDEEIIQKKEDIKDEEAGNAFGFLEEEDIVKKKGVKLETRIKEESKEEEEIIEPQEKIETEEEIEEVNIERNKGKIFFVFLTSLFKSLKIFNKIPIRNIHFPFSFNSNKKIILIPPLILCFLIIVLVFYLLTIKATIVIGAIPKVVEQNQDVTFSAGVPSDLGKNIISSELIPVSEEGEVSDDVTGKKEVGTPAKGTVTIYSRISSGKTFSEGTLLKANGLEFTLDKSVTVASSSGDASSSPTTAMVAVTAKDIGKESNLPSATKFSVAAYDLSDIVAKNDMAFSGGTKKEINAVSKEDQNKLLSDLPKNLEEKAKESLLQKIGTDQEILPIFISSTVDNKEFNHKIGDEASSLTLKGKVSFQGVSYKKIDIEEIGKRAVKENEDFDFIKNGIKYEIQETKAKGKNDVTAKLHVKAFLLPKFDEKKIIDQIKGKSFSQAEEILANLPQISKVEIKKNPNIPLLPKILPRFSNNITLDLVTLN